MTGTGYPLPPQPLYYPPPPPPGFGYQYRYAGVLQRFGAVLIDSILLIIVAVLIAIPIGILAVASWLAFGNPGWYFATFFGPWDLLFLFLGVIYFTYFEGTTGQTPGKRAMGLRVIVPATGRPPDFGKALVRNLLRILDWLPGLYLVGVLAILLSTHKQRVGDIVAETVVIRV